MIAKLERRQSNAYKNKDQIRNYTNNGRNNITINQQQQNNRLRTNNSPSYRGWGNGWLHAFYWYQTFALDSVVVKTHKLLSSHGDFLTNAMYHPRVNLIKLTYYDETKERAHDSNIVQAKDNPLKGIYLSKALTCMKIVQFKQKLLFLPRRRILLATLLYEQLIHLT